MKLAILALLAATAFASPAIAQQNQTPGDTTAGGSSESSATTNQPGKAQTAEAGADTVDSATTGSSGPKKKKKPGPPGDIEAPPLPSPELCGSFEGSVKSACLFTVTGQPSGEQNEQ